ncbi:MAG: proline--tRNA ligase [Deltaproteobacteria bacterium]|nr:proline--tRNA ligase [Deltaproteobacteria bacterium]
MRLTRMFLPTLRTTPSDAEVASHRLMMRAGMIRKVAAGIYNLLPMGLRAVRKVERIVREEMGRAGAEEVLMPVVLPAELWKESGRWDAYGKELLRFTDRHNRDFCFGPTHEEAVTDMVRGEVRSYRDLPKNLYQIQTKFRDEIRPRFGLMRGREFTMKDGYSFHADEKSAEKEYGNMHDTYCRIFERCGLRFRAVEAETGPIGGSFSHEFTVLADTGEDSILSCNRCDYAANIERAERRYEVIGAPASQSCVIKKVSTPGKKSVEDVSAFLGLETSMLIKTLIYETDTGAVAALVRGDRDINEARLRRTLGVVSLRLAEEGTVLRETGAPSGFAGPVGIKTRILADYNVEYMQGAVTGANEVDMHLTGVSSRDFEAEYADIANAASGDGCPRCDGFLVMKRAIEVGHIFKLGTKYSLSMGATFLNESGAEMPMIMGCYGIGIGRTVAAAIEQNHDEDGIIWPVPIAPFHVHIVPVNMSNPPTAAAAEEFYSAFRENSIDVLLDDRDERAGVKFKDADLIGVPLRITISSKTLDKGSIEMKLRSEKQSTLVRREDALARAIDILGQKGMCV